MRLLLVLVMLGSLLSGCTALGDGPDLMTAKQAIGPADRAAGRWADDAVLIDAETQELDGEARREAADEMSDAREELREARDDGDISESDYDNYTELFEVFDVVVKVDDGKVGDGRASLWAFTYRSETEQDFLMVAVAHGDVVYREPMSTLGDDEMDWDDFLDTEALGEWKVDSDEASTAARLDEDFTRICGGKNVASFMSLMQGDDGPVWSVGAVTQGSDDESEFAFLTVDAVDGSLIVDETVVSTPEDVEDILFSEAGVVGGMLQASVQETQESVFEIGNEGHMQMALHARMQPPPLQPVSLTVSDPEGRKTEMTLERGAAPFVALADAVVDGVPVGEYQVEVTSTVSLRHEWSLYWCTDGLPVDQDDLDNPACQVLMEGSSGGGGQFQAETLSPVGRWLAAWQA